MKKEKFLIFRANKTFFLYILKNGKRIIAIQVFMVFINSLVSYINVMSPKMFIDNVVEKHNLPVGLLWIITMISAGIIHGIISCVVSVRKQKVYEKAKLAAKEVFINKMSSFFLSYFDVPKNQNDLQRALSYNESGGIAAIDTLVSLCSSLASLATISYVSLRFDWWIWIAIILLFIFRLTTVPVIRNANFKFNEEQVARDRRVSYYSGILLGSRYLSDIKIFDGLRLFKKKYESEVESNLKINQKFSFTMTMKSMVLSLPDKLFDIFLYIVIGVKLINQEASLGDYTLFFSIIASINGTLNSLSMTYSMISTQEQNAKILYDFLNQKDDVLMLAEKSVAIPEIKSICIKNLTFCYSGQENYALDNVSLQFKKGEKIAIVGYNGAGKTTLVKLLLMLYKPMSGSIAVNGIDMNSIDSKSYWKNCSVLFQEHNEYAVTIAENVLLSEFEEMDLHKVEDALDKAGLKNKVDLMENGLDTPFTRMFYDNGVEFSGGERQKLSIARMIAKDASLLIMDEPSSSLDPSYEDQLNAYIRSLPNDKIAIVISHRLSSVRACNRVIFMKNGQVIADGTHENLYALCHEYKSMFDKQMNKYLI